MLTNYVRLHNRLQPTPDELAARQRTLADLLGNPASRIVTFALEKLSAIEADGRFDGELFLASISPVFHLRNKGQSQTALRIAARLVDREPKLLPHAVTGILEAPTHPAPEVQRQAADLIEAWSQRLHSDHVTTIRERLEDLAPSLRPRVESLIGRLRPATAKPTERGADNVFALELEKLAREAATLPSPWRERSGLAEALELLCAGQMPGPLKFDLLQARVLTGVTPVEPIKNADQLLDAVAHAIETVDSADELERILDGISRLCGRRSPEFHRRAEPLIKRANDRHSESELDRALADAMPESLYQLVLVWLGGKQPVWGPPRYETVALDRFFDGRVQELAERVVGCRSRPLLAAPTHKGGWIDPCVFVQRLEEVFQGGGEPESFDLIQALLRLAPDGRDRAFTAARELPGHVGARSAGRWAVRKDRILTMAATRQCGWPPDARDAPPAIWMSWRT